MDVAVRQKAQKMQGLVLIQAVGHQIGPGFGLEQLAGFNRLLHQLGSLGVDLTAAQGVVPHLGVAHILVGGQADGGTVGLEPGVGVALQKHVQGGRPGLLHCVAGPPVAPAHAVHNNQYNGFFHI